jgi:hypothetical protein
VDDTACTTSPRTCWCTNVSGTCLQQLQVQKPVDAYIPRMGSKVDLSLITVQGQRGGAMGQRAPH